MNLSSTQRSPVRNTRDLFERDHDRRWREPWPRPWDRYSLRQRRRQGSRGVSHRRGVSRAYQRVCLHPGEVADAGGATVAASLLDRYEPEVVILVAGALPHMRPLQQQTWETFSVNWETDVRITFQWLREALLKPLRPGSRVVVISSGAALNANGSPLSGGYAGAKATQRFITGYAQDEAVRAGLNISFATVLPQFAPLTGVGRPARRTQVAPASPWRSTSSSSAPWSPRRSPAQPWSSSCGQIPPASPAGCSAVTGAGLQELP